MNDTDRDAMFEEMLADLVADHMANLVSPDAATISDADLETSISTKSAAKTVVSVDGSFMTMRSPPIPFRRSGLPEKTHRRFPTFGTWPGPRSAVPRAPAEVTPRRAHHDKWLTRDARDIGSLIVLYPHLFERFDDPNFDRLFSKLMQMTSRDPVSVRRTRHLKAVYGARAMDLAFWERKVRRIKPARWEDATDAFKLTVMGLMMKQRDPWDNLQPSTSSSGYDLSFTLNLRHDYAEDLKAAYIAEAANPKRKHPAAIIRERIELFVGEEVGHPVACCLRTETDRGRLHVHGILGAHPSSRKGVRAALRRAGKPWTRACTRKHQADTQSHPNAGWALYMAKREDEWSAISASARLTAWAREFWNEQRPKIIDHNLRC